jgi:hypothetical protein
MMPTPSKKDFETALQLKRIYLAQLAGELAPPASPRAIETVLATRELRESLSMATWGAELPRRAEFASQGPAVLALWREFAWSRGKPRRDFKHRQSDLRSRKGNPRSHQAREQGALSRVAGH